MSIMLFPGTDLFIKMAWQLAKTNSLMDVFKVSGSGDADWDFWWCFCFFLQVFEQFFSSILLFFCFSRNTRQPSMLVSGLTSAEMSCVVHQDVMNLIFNQLETYSCSCWPFLSLFPLFLFSSFLVSALLPSYFLIPLRFTLNHPTPHLTFHSTSISVITLQNSPQSNFFKLNLINSVPVCSQLGENEINPLNYSLSIYFHSYFLHTDSHSLFQSCVMSNSLSLVLLNFSTCPSRSSDHSGYYLHFHAVCSSCIFSLISYYQFCFYFQFNQSAALLRFFFLFAYFFIFGLSGGNGCFWGHVLVGVCVWCVCGSWQAQDWICNSCDACGGNISHQLPCPCLGIWLDEAHKGRFEDEG
ncbi:hypothetical protein VP01_2269g1 [Puccinia sorghi]|uniref:Uncharacterized protein n=1 Tax=Puccinia sorghi TaxID=27349 RepID=A0A0L6V8A1_9BASI|nr:hypothetical protein VP01_2269g1 [Puccinia sorghi]